MIDLLLVLRSASGSGLDPIFHHLQPRSQRGPITVLPMPEPRPESTQPEARPPGMALPAALLLVSLSGILAWWAWQEGAYFGVVLLPGTVILCAIAGVLLVVLPKSNLRISPPVAVALASLACLALWTLASTLWTPAPDVAVADTQRVFTYALMFAIGLLLGRLLGPRVTLALVTFVVAAALAGIAAVIALLTTHSPLRVLEVDVTLQYPLGYRNANAAFFAIAVFPALGLASDADRDWRLRGLALATATLAIDLILLSQSRASMPAMAIAVSAFLVLSPTRLRSVCWLLLAALPAIAVIPALTDLYAVGNEPHGLRGISDELRAAGWLTCVSALGALLAALLVARLEAHVPGFSSRGGRSNRVVAVLLAALVAGLATVFVIEVGDPIDWIGARAKEFKGGETDLSGHASRFTFNFGSNRYDIWRVALEDAQADPLLGDGAGGFRYTYLQKKEAPRQNVRDAHSVELETLAELGAPGLVFLFAALASIATAAFVSLRRGPPASSLGTVALASGAYWLVHSSVDWFWPYPAVTASALTLLGVACAPGEFRQGPPRWRRWRESAFAGIAILAVSAIPPFLSERYVNHAYAAWRTDLDRAYEDLDRARSLNPLSDVPLLAEGAIAESAGDRSRAITAFGDAAELRPEEWAAHYLLAGLQQDTHPAAARREIEIALDLNPLSGRIQTLARRLGVDATDEPR
jgi:O-Antigen ligase